MGRATIGEPKVDLHAVASALQSAGFTITGVIETRLTPGTLHETTNPVYVLVNETALQCVLVELLAEHSAQDSWLASTPANDAWRAIACSAARAVGGSHSTSLADCILPIETTSPSMLPVMPGARALDAQAADPAPALQSARRSPLGVVWTLNQARVTIPVATAHIAAMAALGGVSGYLLRSAWLLALVPVAYVCGVILKVIGSPYAPGGTAGVCPAGH
jgi:hypothetical protein